MSGFRARASLLLWLHAAWLLALRLSLLGFCDDSMVASRALSPEEQLRSVRAHIAKVQAARGYVSGAKARWRGASFCATAEASGSTCPLYGAHHQKHFQYGCTSLNGAP